MASASTNLSVNSVNNEINGDVNYLMSQLTILAINLLLIITTYSY